MADVVINLNWRSRLAESPISIHSRFRFVILIVIGLTLVRRWGVKMEVAGIGAIGELAVKLTNAVPSVNELLAMVAKCPVAVPEVDGANCTSAW